MYKISILALENCMQSSVTGAFDIFSVASLEWKKHHAPTGDELFSVKIITENGKPVNSFNGLQIQPHSGTDDCTDTDILILPVILGDLNPVLNNTRLIDWIADMGRNGSTICAVCAGVFPAAQTGLLDNRQVTTHWNLVEDFKKRYPAVKLNREKMLIDEGDFITAGGVTAYMDLSLYVINRFGSPDLASAVSRLLLIDPFRRSQTPYSSFSCVRDHGDEDILKVQKWLDENISEPVTIQIMSEISALGERTFNRRFKKATGETPLEYLQYLRTGVARKLLETSNMSFDDITYETGYQDVSSFRRLFKKRTGLTPTEYRNRFRLL